MQKRDRSPREATQWVSEKQEVRADDLPTRRIPTRKIGSQPETPNARPSSRERRRPRPGSPHGPPRPRRARQLADLDLPERLAAAGNIHLFSQDMHGNKPVAAYSIYLATLQRMVVGQLRSQLADVVRDLEGGRRAEKGLMDEAKSLLSDYCNAVRDYDFMAERLKQANDEEEDDPFQISTLSLLDLCLMRDAGLVPTRHKGISWDRLFDVTLPDQKQYENRESILPCESRRRRRDVNMRNLILERLVMGLAGGAALIVPMLVMVLHKDLLTTLLTASVATMLFAGGLAFFGTRLKGETVLASVAAYAAVLVVFVGTSG